MGVMDGIKAMDGMDEVDAMDRNRSAEITKKTGRHTPKNKLPYPEGGVMKTMSFGGYVFPREFVPVLERR